MSLLYPQVHDALEVFDDDILLQTGYARLLEALDVSLLAELPDELLIVSVLFPSLHDCVHSVKVDNCTSFSLPLTLVKLGQHPVKIPLFAQDDHLTVVNLEQFYLKCERTHCGEGLTKDVEAEGASGDHRCFRFIPVHFELLEAFTHQVIFVFIDL